MQKDQHYLTWTEAKMESVKTPLVFFFFTCLIPKRLGGLNLIPNNGYLLSQKVREGGRLDVQIKKLQNQLILVKLDLTLHIS